MLAHWHRILAHPQLCSIAPVYVKCPQYDGHSAGENTVYDLAHDQLLWHISTDSFEVMWRLSSMDLLNRWMTWQNLKLPSNARSLSHQKCWAECEIKVSISRTSAMSLRKTTWKFTNKNSQISLIQCLMFFSIPDG